MLYQHSLLSTDRRSLTGSKGSSLQQMLFPVGRGSSAVDSRQASPTILWGAVGLMSEDPLVEMLYTEHTAAREPVKSADTQQYIVTIEPTP